MEANAIISSIAESLRSYDPTGEATETFDVGTGQRGAAVKLWEGVELIFWVRQRRLLGDQVLWRLTGPLPVELRGDADPQALNGLENVAEYTVSLLCKIAQSLIHFAVIETPKAAEDEEVMTALIWMLTRAKFIGKSLQRIAAEKHEGRYKDLAFAGGVSIEGLRRIAESRLGLESLD